MTLLLAVLACLPGATIDDSAIFDTDPTFADAPEVVLDYVTANAVYGDALLIGDTVVVGQPYFDTLLAFGYSNPPYIPQAFADLVVTADFPERLTLIPGVGIWQGGDQDRVAVLRDPMTLEVIREVNAMGAMAIQRAGSLVTTDPGQLQHYPEDARMGSLVTVNADGSTSLIFAGLCGAQGHDCGRSLVDVDGTVWASDALGGVYAYDGTLTAYHLSAAALVAGEPDVSARAEARITVLDDGYLFVGSPETCGLILNPTNGAQIPYGEDMGCGFEAVDGVSYHGSQVRIVSLNLAVSGGYGALRVEWLDGDHAGEVVQVSFPFRDPAYNCLPHVAFGDEGRFVVTCDHYRGLFAGRVTG